MNEFHEIDKTTWPRRSAFEYYRTFENQLFNITLEFDVENVHRAAKESGRSFFLMTLYAILKAVNAVPALRQRIVEADRVIEFDHVAALTPIMGEEELFTMALAEYADTPEAFFAQAEVAVAAAKRGEFDPALRQRQDYICASCVPWYHFNSLNQAALSLKQSIVILAWGKMDRNYRIPLALQLNHALADGRQVGRFCEALECSIAESRSYNLRPDALSS